MNIYFRRSTFSTLTITSNLPTCKAHLAQVTRACCLQSSTVFVEVELLFHFCAEGQVFPRVGVIMNVKRFDVFLNNKASYKSHNTVKDVPF